MATLRATGFSTVYTPPTASLPLASRHGVESGHSCHLSPGGPVSPGQAGGDPATPRAATPMQGYLLFASGAYRAHDTNSESARVSPASATR